MVDNKILNHSSINSDSLPPLDPPPPVDPPAIDPPAPIDPPPLDPPPLPPAPPISIPTVPQPPNSLPTTPSQPPNSPPPLVPTEAKKGLSFKKLVFSLLIVIIFIFGGTSLTLAYTNYKLFTPPPIIKNSIDKLIIATPLPKTPRLVLAQSQAKMSSVKTMIIEIESEFSTTNTSFPVKSAKVNVKGPLNLKSQNVAGINLEISGEVEMEGLKLSAGGEMRQVEDYLYFRLTQFPGGSFLPLDSFKNQWFYTKIDELDKENRPPADEEKIQKLVEVFQNFQGKSHEWTELTKDGDFYVARISPPREEIDNLLFEIIQILEPKEGTKLEDSVQKENLGKLTKDLQNIELIVKIDKKDYLVRESALSFLFNVDAPANLFSQSGIVNLAPTTSVPISIALTVRLSDYNQPVIVEIPEGAKDIKEYTDQLLTSAPQLFQSPFESTPEASPDSQSGIHDFLLQPSPVLGEKKFWDLNLLNSLEQIF